jgi:hypothetical protein
MPFSAAGSFTVTAWIWNVTMLTLLVVRVKHGLTAMVIHLFYNNVGSAKSTEHTLQSQQKKIFFDCL